MPTIVKRGIQVLLCKINDQAAAAAKPLGASGTLPLAGPAPALPRQWARGWVAGRVPHVLEALGLSLSQPCCRLSGDNLHSIPHSCLLSIFNDRLRDALVASPLGPSCVTRTEALAGTLSQVTPAETEEAGVGLVMDRARGAAQALCAVGTTGPLQTPGAVFGPRPCQGWGGSFHR